MSGAADPNRKPLPRGIITLAKLLARAAAAEEHERRIASQPEAPPATR